MTQPTASVLFTVEELWMLQSAIRHEITQGDTWKYPPASLELNDQVAESLLRCQDLGLAESALVLTRGDCLVIDYCTPQGAKTPSGAPIGKQILLKSFLARKQVLEGTSPTVEEPLAPSAAEVRERLRNRQEE
jgi:hypothetical protein